MKIKILAVLAASQITAFSFANEQQNLSFDQLKQKCNETLSDGKRQALEFKTDLSCKAKKTFWRKAGERVQSFDNLTVIDAMLSLKGGEVTAMYEGSISNEAFKQSCQVMEKWSVSVNVNRQALSCSDLAKYTSEKEICAPVLATKLEACNPSMEKVKNGGGGIHNSDLCRFEQEKNEQGNPIVKGCEGVEIAKNAPPVDSSSDSSSDNCPADKQLLAENFKEVDAMDVKLVIFDRGGPSWKHPFRYHHKYKLILVGKVPAGSLLDQMGIKEGDKIRRFNGKGINHRFSSADEFKKLIKKKLMKDRKFSFRVERGTEEVATPEVTLACACQPANALDQVPSDKKAPTPVEPVSVEPAPAPVEPAPVEPAPIEPAPKS